MTSQEISSLFANIDRVFIPKDTLIVEPGQSCSMFVSSVRFLIRSLLILSGTLSISEEGKEDTLWSRPSADSFLLFSEVLLQLLDPNWKSVALFFSLLDSSRSLFAQ